MTRKSTRGGALLDLILTNKEETVGDVKAVDHCGCSDHVMMEISILREGNKANSKTTIAEQADSLFRDLFGRIPLETVLGGGDKIS